MDSVARILRRRRVLMSPNTRQSYSDRRRAAPRDVRKRRRLPETTRNVPVAAFPRGFRATRPCSEPSPTAESAAPRAAWTRGRIDVAPGRARRGHGRVAPHRLIGRARSRLPRITRTRQRCAPAGEDQEQRSDDDVVPHLLVALVAQDERRGNEPYADRRVDPARGLRSFGRPRKARRGEDEDDDADDQIVPIGLPRYRQRERRDDQPEAEHQIDRARRPNLSSGTSTRQGIRTS